VRTSVRRGEFTAVPVDEAPLPDPQPDPEQQAGSRERVEQLQAALRGLGERCRQLLRLKLQGKKFAEIQAEMGAASINTIYTWDLRCRKQLLEAMGGDWEEGRGR
jgi:RNA polymerase sigma-70 factor (ECF subfamily)